MGSAIPTDPALCAIVPPALSAATQGMRLHAQVFQKKGLDLLRSCEQVPRACVSLGQRTDRATRKHSEPSDGKQAVQIGAAAGSSPFSNEFKVRPERFRTSGGEISGRERLLKG